MSHPEDRKLSDTASRPLPKLFLFNGTFDLELGGFPTDKVKAAVDEMACLFGLIGTDRDRRILSVRLPESYPEHLTDHGLVFATPYNESCRVRLSACPWGWTENAVSAFKNVNAAMQHPPLPEVRTVNSRKFVYDELTQFGCGIPQSRFCNTADECAVVIRAGRGRPFVVKPAFGSAGFGFIHTSSAGLTRSQLEAVGRTIERTGEGVSVEPWLNRVGDLSTSGTVTTSGELRDISIHRTLNNRAGAFFAVLLCRDDPQLRPWHSRLIETARAAAAAAARHGYSGPMGLDSLLWNDGYQTHLVPVIEINARYTMSTIARAVRDRLAPDRFCIFRFIARRRHRLPETYDKFLERLDSLAYNPVDKNGVVLLSPLRILHAQGKWRQPSRSAFFISADTERAALALDEKLRETLS